jgi:hypothetical protein
MSRPMDMMYFLSRRVLEPSSFNITSRIAAQVSGEIETLTMRNDMPLVNSALHDRHPCACRGSKMLQLPFMIRAGVLLSRPVSQVDTR